MSSSKTTIWIATVFCAACVAMTAASQTSQPTRKHHPESAYIPLMSPQEKAYVANVIQLVLLNDLNPGPGPNNKEQFQRAFNGLGPEALPLMIEWMNYSTAHGWTCPCNILDRKLCHFMDYARRKLDVDTLEFMERELWKGMKVDPPQPLMGIRSMVSGGAKNARMGKEFHLSKLGFVDLMKMARGETLNHQALKNANFDTSAKLADWRMMIKSIGTKKDKEEAFDLLLKAIEKPETPLQRSTIHNAMRNWSGANSEPTAEKWQEWRKKKNTLMAPLQNPIVGK